jgi:hypothetical protein
VNLRRWNWKRIWIVAGIAFGVFVIGGVVLAGRDIPLIPPSTQPMTLKGGRINGTHISTKSWSFDYEHAQLSPDGTMGTIDGVRNGVVYRKGKPYLKISAEHVSLNTSTLDFTATGRVHVERLKGGDARSFDTDLVIWTNGAKLLHLDHPSYVRTNGQVLKIENVTMDFEKDVLHLGKIDGNVDIHH